MTVDEPTTGDLRATPARRSSEGCRPRPKRLHHALGSSRLFRSDAPDEKAADALAPPEQAQRAVPGE